MHSVTLLSGSVIDRLKTIPASLTPATASKISGDTLLPGASALPASVGRLLTIKNAFVGAAAVVGIYMAYSVFMMPPRKPRASAPSTAAAVAGLFGRRYRRRR